MVADAARFPSSPFASPRALPSRATKADAIVPLEAGAPDLTLAALVTALLDDETLVDVGGASPKQRQLFAQLVPAARLVLGDRAELARLRVWLPRGVGARRNWAQRATLCRSALLRPLFDKVRAECCGAARRIATV